MPSGSHFGSSGSHRSGGASHVKTSSNRVSSHSRYIGFPFFSTIFISRGIRTSVPQKYKWASILCSFLFIIAIFTLFFAILFLTLSLNLSKIEQDYMYYQDMISYAENNPDKNLIREAVVKDFALNEECGKYYIIYELDTDDGSGKLEGYSFSVYTLTTVPRVDEHISVAVNSSEVTTETDSIPMDYKDMPLTQDGEWIVARKNVTIRNILFIVTATCFLSIIVIYIFLHIKVKKNYNAEKQNGKEFSNNNPPPKKELSQTTSQETNFDNPFEKNYFKCSNCGADVLPEQRYCPLCGKKIKK